MKLEEDLVRYVSDLKNIFFNEFVKLIKVSKEKVNKSIVSLNEQLQCIKKCQYLLLNIVFDNLDVVKQVIEFCRSKYIVYYL